MHKRDREPRRSPQFLPFLRRRAGRWGSLFVALLAFVLWAWMTSTASNVGPSHPLLISGYGVVASFLAFAAVVALALFLGTFLGKPVVSVDEGGVRWKQGFHKRYLPYARVHDARLQQSVFGRPILALYTDSGVEHLALDNVDPQPLFRAVLFRISKKTRQAAIDTDTFERRGRDLDRWLSDVRAATGGETSAYRARPVDIGALEQTALDENADHELRAAAVHALLSKDDRVVAAQVLESISAGTPPLVVVAASLAKYGNAVNAALVEEATHYISDADKTAVAIRARAPEVRVRVADDVDAVALLGEQEDDQRCGVTSSAHENRRISAGPG